ncbi:MAG TPA: hypothetical protein VIA81_09635 [Acidimicrobiia bacterium]|jgi:hypothetical protein
MIQIEQLTVRRSGLRMWLWAISGVPLIVLGVDVLFRRRLINALSSVVFNPNEPQLIEPRDVIWAVVMLAVGLILTGIGLKELVVPRPVVKADRNGLQLHLGHPFARPVLLPWDEIDDVGAEQLNDEGDVIPVMWVRTDRPDQLPRHPWGARWIDHNTIAILGSDWEMKPRQVAELVADVAVNTARTAPPPVESQPQVGAERRA